MKIDQEIKDLISGYVKKIEGKENKLTSFKEEVEKIINSSMKETAEATALFDMKFDNNEISEGDYLSLLREKRESILKATKKRLDNLIENIQRD